MPEQGSGAQEHRPRNTDHVQKEDVFHLRHPGLPVPSVNWHVMWPAAPQAKAQGDPGCVGHSSCLQSTDGSSQWVWRTQEASDKVWWWDDAAVLLEPCPPRRGK